MLTMAESDIQTNDEIKVKMVAFISKLFGHSSWEKMVEMRWLRNRANIKSYHFDADKEHIVAVSYDGPKDRAKKLNETAGSNLTDKLTAGYTNLEKNQAQIVKDAMHRPSIKMDRLAEERKEAELRKAVNKPGSDGHPSKWLGVLLRESKAKKEAEASAKKLKDAKVNMFLDSSDEEETMKIR